MVKIMEAQGASTVGILWSGKEIPLRAPMRCLLELCMALPNLLDVRLAFSQESGVNGEGAGVPQVG